MRRLPRPGLYVSEKSQLVLLHYGTAHLHGVSDQAVSPSMSICFEFAPTRLSLVATDRGYLLRRILRSSRAAFAPVAIAETGAMTPRDQADLAHGPFQNPLVVDRFASRESG